MYPHGISFYKSEERSLRKCWRCAINNKFDTCLQIKSFGTDGDFYGVYAHIYMILIR